MVKNAVLPALPLPSAKDEKHGDADDERRKHVCRLPWVGGSSPGQANQEGNGSGHDEEIPDIVSGRFSTRQSDQSVSVVGRGLRRSSFPRSDTGQAFRHVQARLVLSVLSLTGRWPVGTACEKRREPDDE